MYGYYFLATLGYNVWWKKYLTLLQISQVDSLIYIYIIHMQYNKVPFISFYPAIDGQTETIVFSSLQLAMFVVQGVSLLFTGDPEFRVIGAVNGVYAFTLLSLFVNFYRQSYSARKTRKTV